MAFRNPPPDEIRALLQQVRTIAVLGLSPRPDRPSHQVAKALKGFGYRIIPVRPGVSEVLGEKAYPDLASVPERIDLVDVFRAPEYLDGIVDECIRLKIPAIWIQEGIVNDTAAQRAREAGLFVVMDRCIYKDHVALIGAHS